MGQGGGSYPKIHPTQKPVSVLKRLIEIYTDPGDVVIDPVAGSGSTLRACAELNRSCYGFEIKMKASVWNHETRKTNEKIKWSKIGMFITYSYENETLLEQTCISDIVSRMAKMK